MIEVENLSKTYVDTPVVNGLSFFVPEGQVLGFLGPNGAGKSSLLRVLAGFIPAAEGNITLTGIPEDTPIGEHCHYVGHLNGVKRALNVRENLEFWAAFLGGGDVDKALDVVLTPKFGWRRESEKCVVIVGDAHRMNRSAASSGSSS